MKRYIRFDLEGKDKEAAFFALYAGLRMYKEQKGQQLREKGAFSIAAAEAYCMLQELQKQFPAWYADAEIEFQEVYGKFYQQQQN